MSEKCVIIIDDSKYIIGLLERFFVEQLHFKVVATALDGTEALDLYRRFKPDLLTLDLSMPNKDGKDVLKELINEFPEANILIISAIRGDAILQCLSIGAKGYIEKPLRFSSTEFIEDFIESVKEAVGESEPPK